jgi:hypothetical protein
MPARRRRPSPNAGARSLSRNERLTPDIQEKLLALENMFATIKDEAGRNVFGTIGVYAFFDFDDEPIYVGQTYEGLRTRIRRHLTNQRTDAVAMHVLDPVEVASIQVWPFWDLGLATFAEKKVVLDRAEYTVYKMLIERSPIGAILNEKVPAKTDTVELPPSYGGSIVPPGSRDRLFHRDERITRRAETMANLSRVIKERDVSIGLRKTLVTQSRRLERLAVRRLEEVLGEMAPEEIERETIEQPEDAGDIDLG